MKNYFIHVDYMPVLDRTRVQLKDERGTRPGMRVATETTPERVYVKYYRSVVQGVRHFTRYRDELEGRIN